MISIRKLAAVDMAWLGPRIILAEYAIGVVLPLVLGGASVRSGFFGPVRSAWESARGTWLASIAANYVTLLMYAIVLARSGTAKQEGQPELAHARRYGAQLAMILVPLMVVVVALTQELRRVRES